MRYLPSSKYNISTQEHTKTGSKGTIILHYPFIREKSFLMAYQKNFPYISLAKNTARAQSMFIIQEERKMALCSVKD